MKEEFEWLNQAEEDLDTAKFNFNGGRHKPAAFYSQQAAEKALKALYILKFKRLWKIHDLFELGEKVGAPKDILDLCEKLNPHYLATRYPSEEEYTEEMAEEALKFSERW